MEAVDSLMFIFVFALLFQFVY